MRLSHRVCLPSSLKTVAENERITERESQEQLLLWKSDLAAERHGGPRAAQPSAASLLLFIKFPAHIAHMRGVRHGQTLIFFFSQL